MSTKMGSRSRSSVPFGLEAAENPEARRHTPVPTPTRSLNGLLHPVRGSLVWKSCSLCEPDTDDLSALYPHRLQHSALRWYLTLAHRSL